MLAPDRPTTARRSAFVPVCAAWAALLAVAGLVGACLNPMPDDFPSGQGGTPNRNPVPDVVGSAGSEAGGGSPEPGGAGAAGSAGAQGNVDVPPPNQVEPDPSDAGSGGADAGDAGDAGVTP